MSLNKYLIVEESKDGYMLLKKDSKGTVIRLDRERGQVIGVMPGDMPKDGLSWYARYSDPGVDSVSHLYNYRYARRVFSGYRDKK